MCIRRRTGSVQKLLVLFGSPHDLLDCCLLARQPQPNALHNGFERAKHAYTLPVRGVAGVLGRCDRLRVERRGEEERGEREGGHHGQQHGAQQREWVDGRGAKGIHDRMLVLQTRKVHDPPERLLAREVGVPRPGPEAAGEETALGVGGGPVEARADPLVVLVVPFGLMFEGLVRVLLVVGREFDGEDEQGERDDAVIRRTELLRGLDRGNVRGDAEKEEEDVWMADMKVRFTIWKRTGCSWARRTAQR